MDKFGIFNLLNSLVNGNTATPDAQSERNNLINDLLGALAKPKKQAEEIKSKAPDSPAAPLQSGMLRAMASHDALVKRVKEKAKDETKA